MTTRLLPRPAGRTLCAAVAILLAAPLLCAQATIKINGSSTTHKMVVPHAAAAASAHSVKIEFVPNGTGHGLVDLASGRCQVGMMTGDLAYFAKLINERKPGSFPAEQMRTFRLADLSQTAAVAIVHPSNPVSSLTHEQIKGLFTGQITNWKEVGGPDLAVVPVLPDVFDGVCAALSVDIMHNVPSAASTRRVQAAPDTNRVVAQLPGAVSFLSIANAAGNVRQVAPQPEFIPPNYLVTIGEPAEPIKSVIAEFQARVK